jgi:hypothetical protein
LLEEVLQIGGHKKMGALLSYGDMLNEALMAMRIRPIAILNCCSRIKTRRWFHVGGHALRLLAKWRQVGAHVLADPVDQTTRLGC